MIMVNHNLSLQRSLIFPLHSPRSLSPPMPYAPIKGGHAHHPLLLQLLCIPTQYWNVTFPWILWKDYQRVKIKMLFWLWPTESLNMLILFCLVTHSWPKTIAEIFLEEIVQLHDFPNTIVSNRDNKICLSHFLTELFKLVGTKLKFSTIYHPKTDGQTEVVNQCLETYLRCLTGTQSKLWTKWLRWAEFRLNTNYHDSKSTPFKALYRRDLPHLLKSMTIQSTIEEVNQLTQETDNIKWS